MNYGKKGVKDRQHYITPILGKLGKKGWVTALQLALVGFLVIIVTVTCAGIGIFVGIIKNTETLSPEDVAPTDYKTVVYDCNGNVSQEFVGSESNRVYVSIEQIPLDLQHAFVAIEDERFYTHNGIDPKGILRAASIAFSSGSLDQGASTITQQLIKNNYFNAFNESTSEKIKRKIQEQYLALKLEETLSKDEILESYLNTINLGNGNFGVQAAAKNYFDKDVSELTISECALIAGITQRPEAYNPVRHPEANADRRDGVLKKMLKQGYITQAQFDEAQADDIYARIQNVQEYTETTTTYSYFTDELIKQVKKDLMEQKGYSESQALNKIYRGGLTIISTQDLNIQAIIDEEFANPDNFPSSTKVSLDYTLMVEELDGKVYTYSDNSLVYYFYKHEDPKFTNMFSSKERADEYIARFKEIMLADGGKVTYERVNYIMQPQASMTLLDQTNGQVKALIGGRGEKTASLTFNRATEAMRQPGSTFKPITTYGPAFDMGKLTLASVIDDAPYHYSDGKLVSNHENNYEGLMSVRYAIGVSRNIPAVKSLAYITPQIGLNYALNFGFTTLVTPQNMINGNHDMVESLCLGGLTKGVYNIELCAAYATFANGGVYNEPIYYTAVYDHDGNLILDNSDQDTHRVIKKSTSEIVTSALLTATEIGTGYWTNIRDVQPVAGKTGTTNDDVDKWYVGFTPYYTGAIWFGYDDNSSYDGNFNTHCILWGKIMRRVHEGLERGEFTMDDDIVQVEVCAQSGLLPVDGVCDHDPRGSQLKTEYFIRGTEPTEKCDVHVKVDICNDTKQIAVAGCKNKTTMVYIKKGPTTLTPVTDSKYEEDARYGVGDAKYELPKNLTSCVKHAKATTTTPGQSSTEKSTSSSSTKPTLSPTNKPGTEKETTKPSTEKETTKPSSEKETIKNHN